MFCDECQTLMNITANVSNTETSDITKTEISTTTPNSKKYYNITKEDLDNILENNDIEYEVIEENYNDVLEDEYFLSLTDNQRTKIINRLLEKLNKKIKNSKKLVSSKIYYFYCDNCGFNKEIPPKTLIYSNTTTEIDNNFINNKYDDTLPKTKNYNCVNDKCKTHKDPSIKEATFYRINNTYNIRYICHICDTYW
jgi:hypothetical protein